MEEQDPQKIKEQLEELRTLIATSKQELINSKAVLASLNQVVTSIQNYNQKFDEIRKKIEDPAEGIVTNLESTKRVKLEIDTLRQDSETQLNTIKTTLASVQANITAMNAEYIKFTEINSTISNPESGLSSIFKKSTQVKLEIDKLLQDSETQLTQIKTILVSVQTNITAMNAEYIKFTEIKIKIDNPETGLVKVLETSDKTKQEIIALKKQSEVLFQEIKKFRDESQNYTKEIEELKKLSEEGKNTIEKYEEESKVSLSRIEKIYKIATDSGLANSFDKRKQDLQDTTRAWFWALLAFTALLAGALFAIFYPTLISKTISIDEYTWYRLTLTSPLIFFITFASIRYSKERDLLEKYAFKAVTAFSLESYTTLLINTFDKEKNEQYILNFVLNSMSSIYKEPHEIVKESKFSFGLDSKLASLKADFTDTMEETKKDIVKKVQEEISKTSDKPKVI